MIDKKGTEHLLELSRLEISESEKKDLQNDLKLILEYIDQLEEVDVTGVEPMTGGTFNINEYRKEDFKENDFEKDPLLSSAPKQSDDYFEIKNIF